MNEIQRQAILNVLRQLETTSSAGEIERIQGARRALEEWNLQGEIPCARDLKRWGIPIAEMEDLERQQARVLFNQWISVKRSRWYGMQWQRQFDAYGERLIAEIEVALQEMERLYGDLADTGDYQRIKGELQAEGESLQRQLDDWKAAQSRLEEADRLLKGALREIGKLTPESWQEARTLLNRAREALDTVPPACEPSRKEQLCEWIQNGFELLHYVGKPSVRPTSQAQLINILDLVKETRDALEEMKKRLEKPDTPQSIDEALTRAHQMCSAANRSLDQRFWEKCLPVPEGQLLPALTELTREISNWYRMHPFLRRRGCLGVIFGGR